MWFLGFVILTFVTVLPLSLRRRQSSRIDYCEIIYPVSAYMYMGTGLRGLALCMGWQDTPIIEAYRVLRANTAAPFYVFLIAALGVGSLYAGYFLPRAHRWAISIGKSRMFVGPHNFSVMGAICFLYALATGVASFYVWRTYVTPNALIHATAQGGLYPITGLSRLGFIGLLVSAALMAKNPTSASRIVWFINIVATVCWFLASSVKYSILLLLLGLLIVRNYLTRRASAGVLTLAALGMLFLYPTLNVYRYEGWQAFRTSLPERFSGPDLLIHRLHHFDLLLVIVDRVRGLEDLKLGSTFSEIGYFYIPRAIWPDKPMSFGYRFAEEYTPAEFWFGRTGGSTPSLPGELFLNFHLPGVIVGMFICGVFLKNIYVFLGAGGTSPLKASIYALFVVNSLELVEGPLASHIETFILDMIPILLISIVSSRLAKQMPRRVGTDPAKYAHLLRHDYQGNE
jgi:hypothetical protein